MPYCELAIDSKQLYLNSNGYFYYYDESAEPGGEVALKDGSYQLIYVDALDGSIESAGEQNLSFYIANGYEQFVRFEDCFGVKGHHKYGLKKLL